MVEFRLSYGPVLRHWLFINLVITGLLTVVLLLRRHDFSLTNLPFGSYLPLLALSTVAVAVQFVLAAPPIVIQIDQAANTVNYARFFRRGLVRLEYQRVRSEFTTRRRGRSTLHGWSLLYDGHEQLFVEFDSTGWSEAKLQAIHQLLRPMLPA